MARLSCPLQWLHGIMCTRDRRSGQFKSKNEKGWVTRLTVAAALDRLQEQVARMGGHALEVSANWRTTRAGNPTASDEPTSPEVVASFYVGSKLYTLPCDTYTQGSQNVAAIAAHLDAVRAIERHGVATAEQMMTAFAALPAPADAADWRSVLGASTPAEAEARYRELAKVHHPDAGGKAEDMAKISAAIKAAREEGK